MNGLPIPLFPSGVTQFLGFIFPEENPPVEFPDSSPERPIILPRQTSVGRSVIRKQSYAERIHTASPRILETTTRVSEEDSSDDSNYLGLAAAVGLAFLSPGLFILGALVGCGATRTHEVTPSQERQPSRNIRFEEAAEALIEHEQICETTPNCPGGMRETSRLLAQWLESLGRADLTSDSPALRNTVQRAQGLGETPSSFLRFLRGTVEFVNLIEEYRENPSAVDLREMVRLFLDINMNLFSHRGRPLFLLADYLFERATLMPEETSTELLQLFGIFLLWLNNALTCRPGEGYPLGPEETNCNERLLHSLIRSFETQLLSDGRISPLENQLIEGLAIRWRGHFGIEGLVAGYLTLMAQNQSVEGDFLAGPLVTLTDEHGAVYRFMVNRGIGVSPAQERDILRDLIPSYHPSYSGVTERSFWNSYRRRTRLANGFTHVPNPNHTILAGHVLSESCFEAALCSSHDLRCHFPFGPALELRREYRMLSGQERAAPGDILAYFNPELWDNSERDREYFQQDYTSVLNMPNGRRIALQPLHLSIVTAVNPQGIPTRAIGKMGNGGSIISHNADQVFGIYGPLIGVFQRR